MTNENITSSDNQNPLISIITPVYNGGLYLEECLRSALAQTYENIEVLVLDDGSGDDSFQIASQIAEQDSRVKVFQLDHGGQGRARNIGIKHAQGEYITFLDADDCLVPEALDALLESLVSTNADFSICSYSYLREDGSRQPHKMENYFDQQVLFGQSIAINILNSSYYFSVAKLFRTSFIKDNQISFLEGHIYEDNPFCVAIALKATTVSTIPEPLYYVRKHRLSSTQSSYETSKHYVDYIVAVSQCISLLTSSSAKRDGRINYYYVRYAYKRFLQYYYNRTPRVYRKAFASDYVREMQRLGDFPIEKTNDTVLRLCQKWSVFKKQKVTLFRFLLFIKRLQTPSLRG